MYMLDLYKRGLSRKNGGGTLFTYAANISHLIRYCWQRRIDPIDLTDDQFTQFVLSLMSQRRRRKPEVAARDANSVIAIGRNSLDFLASVGRHACDDGFLGPQGRICCEQREFVVRQSASRRSGPPLIRKYWHHRALPPPDPKKGRMPISSDLIDKLRAAVEPASKTTHLRKRRYVTIKLLEITGGRRAEVAAITVAAIRAAAGIENPMLLIPTLKKQGGRGESRLIPIHPHDVRSLIEYIDVNRARVIRRTCGTPKDDGILLINGKTGKPIKAATITKEIRLLAAEAGIVAQACPHMFRHRFITKLFVALIQAHNCTNEGEFRKLLLDGFTLKEKVREWTGHAAIESLDPYIHLAFDEISNFKRTYDLVSTKLVVESFSATIDQAVAELTNAHRNGEPQAPIFDGFVELLRSFKRDLERMDPSIESKA